MQILYGISPADLRLVFASANVNFADRTAAIQQYLDTHQTEIDEFWGAEGWDLYCPFCDLALPKGTPITGAASGITILPCNHVIHRTCVTSCVLDLTVQCPECQREALWVDHELYELPADLSDVEFIDLTADSDDDSADMAQDVHAIKDLTLDDA